ncbi:15323_t:CDS:2, partial [Cetraspora pellucida]
LVQNLSTSEEDNAVFYLKRDAYNGYDPKGQHTNVADITKCQPIISVTREL